MFICQQKCIETFTKTEYLKMFTFNFLINFDGYLILAVEIKINCVELLTNNLISLN